MATSYQSLGQECASFYINDNAAFGTPCKVIGNNTVAPCEASDAFCGIIQSVRDGLACVAYRGFVTAHYSGTVPSKGYCMLSAGEDGTVAVASKGATSYLVVNVDLSAQTVTFLI